MISPSEIAVRAAGLGPAGMHAADHDGICAMCGTPYRKGEPVEPFAMGETFTDYSALRHPSGTHLCQWCPKSLGREFSQTYLRTVICREGIFPASSNENRAYWLLNPPEGPWLFLQGDQKIQHVVFRAPVNLGKEVYQIRMGDMVATVRRSKLVEGMAAAKELADFATAIARRRTKRPQPYKTPFVSVSRDFTSVLHGCLRHELHEEALVNPDVQRLIETVESLTPGELWGLTAVMYAKPERPQATEKLSD
jgi:CRISPR type IV-associated protein Csf1